MSMLDPPREVGDAPTDISQFKRVWLLTLMLSAVIAILMFDYSVTVVGPYPAALINVSLFAFTVTLMVGVTRRSNLARWLLVIFVGGFTMLYDLSHLALMFTMFPVAYLAIVRLGLTAFGFYLLFTPNSRAWFAGKPMPDDDGYP